MTAPSMFFIDEDKLQVISRVLEEELMPNITTGFMLQNGLNSRAEWMFGKSWKRPRMDVDGFGDYDRALGYPAGDVAIDWETFDTEFDRGRFFGIDNLENIEMGDMTNVIKVGSKFMRDKAAPEVDAIAWQRTYARTIAANPDALNTADMTKAQILDALTGDIDDIQDIYGPGRQLICAINSKISGMITKGLQANYQPANYEQGRLYTDTYVVNDTPLLKVPSASFMTSYIMYDGRSAAEMDGGIRAAPNAIPMNWIIMPADVAELYYRIRDTKVVPRMVNPTHDADGIAFRHTYDVQITEQNTELIRINTGLITAGV